MTPLPWYQGRTSRKGRGIYKGEGHILRGVAHKGEWHNYTQAHKGEGHRLRLRRGRGIDSGSEGGVAYIYGGVARPFPSNTHHLRPPCIWNCITSITSTTVLQNHYITSTTVLPHVIAPLTYLRTSEVLPTPGAPIMITLADRRLKVEENS